MPGHFRSLIVSANRDLDAVVTLNVPTNNCVLKTETQNCAENLALNLSVIETFSLPTSLVICAKDVTKMGGSANIYSICRES